MGKFLMGLTAAMVIGAVIQAPAVWSGEVGKPGTLLLAQLTGKTEKQEAEALRTEQEKRLKEMHLEKSKEEERLMEKSDSKALQESPAAAGTKKVGGQTIRGKKILEGD